MEEFLATGLHWNTVELSPDGLMRVQGFAFPQSASLENMVAGDVTFSKESGEGKDLTLNHPRGTIIASYLDRQWRIRTDIQDVRQAANTACAFAATPKQIMGVPEDAFPYPIPGPVESSNSPSVSSRLMQATLNFLCIAAILLLCFFLFEEPITQFATGFAAKEKKAASNAQAKITEYQREESYRKLESLVRQLHTEASKKLDELQAAVRTYVAEFEQAAGVSPERIVTAPKDTPREVDTAMLSDDGFLRAWNQAVNAYPPRSTIENNQRVLSDVYKRIATKTLDDSDQKRLATLILTLDEAGTLLESQKPGLEIIRNGIVRERLRTQVDSNERSVP